jgi:hypothetical protein
MKKLDELMNPPDEEMEDIKKMIASGVIPKYREDLK